MKFVFEQLAICPPAGKREEALQLLQDIGLCDKFVMDNVTAVGEVFGEVGKNIAELAFNYSSLDQAREFEVLSYMAGPNWMESHDPSVSHFGMHCSAEELEQWRAFFFERNIKIAQEVRTLQHTNPTIKGRRWYTYVIFDTRPILGVDLKFIVRMEEPK